MIIVEYDVLEFKWISTFSYTSYETGELLSGMLCSNLGLFNRAKFINIKLFLLTSSKNDPFVKYFTTNYLGYDFIQQVILHELI